MLVKNLDIRTPPGTILPAIMFPPSSVLRTVLPDTGGKMRNDSLRTATIYLRPLTLDMVISLSFAKVLRTSLLTFASRSGCLHRSHVAVDRVVAVVSLPATIKTVAVEFISSISIARSVERLSTTPVMLVCLVVVSKSTRLSPYKDPS